MVAPLEYVRTNFFPQKILLLLSEFVNNILVKYLRILHKIFIVGKILFNFK